MKKLDKFLENTLVKEVPQYDVELQNLAVRIFNEEIKIFNSAFKDVSGMKAFDSYDNLLSRRNICRSFHNKRHSETANKIRKIAKDITDKTLSEIDFRENTLDQLKIRIKLREFFSVILLATLMQRIKNLFKPTTNNN